MTITLDLNIETEKMLTESDKTKLSFLVSRVFEEYLEELQDEKLGQEIANSKELDILLSNLKL